jgi:uncharacterized caspase-like protein
MASENPSGTGGAFALYRLMEKTFLKHSSPISLLFCLCLIFAGCTSHVIKMPKSLPDIVMQYKTITVQGDRPGMVNTGVRVNRGDRVTFLGKGVITYFPPKGLSAGPADAKLLIRIGETSPANRFYGFLSGVYAATQEGDIYLGFEDGGFLPSGEAKSPENYRDNTGYFVIDILVWREYDPVRISDFLEQLSRDDPNNESLKTVSDSYKGIKEANLFQRRAAEEVRRTRQAISALKGEAISQAKPPVEEEIRVPEVSRKLKEEARAAIETVQRDGRAGVLDQEKERKIADLTEKLEQALKSLTTLEEMSLKLARQQEKEKELAARVRLLEGEKQKSPEALPLIAILSPKDGAALETECVPLSGVAEHQNGITRLDILINNALIAPKDKRLLKIAPKEQTRIDFSERICLREGKNEITVLAQDRDGASARKTISVHLKKKPGEVWAVVIGINKYSHLPSLKYAVNDAREFYRYLVDVNKVPEENVWLILDEDATLDKVKSTLGTRLRRSAGKEDTVIIYLAGHGAMESDSSSPDGDGLEKYILPYNADPKDLYSSAMPMREIAQIFQRISSDRLILITDMCYSGAAGGRTVPVPGIRANISGAFLERISRGRGRVVLTAGDANEVTVERDDLRHGVFTYFLLEGLRGKADADGNGIITVDEVYRYVSIKVPQATGQAQHPVRKGETKGELVLGVLK